MTRKKEITQEQFVAAFIYSLGKDEDIPATKTFAQVMGGVFLIERKLVERFNEDEIYDYEPSKYLPRSTIVRSLLEEFEDEGYIKMIEPSNPHEGLNIEVTKSGMDFGKEAYDHLDSEKQRLVDWVSEKHASSSGRLVSFLTNQYEEYYTN